MPDTALPHVAQQLVALAGVEADLSDDEPGTAGDLFFELEQLRHDFVFVPLEVGGDGAGEKGGRLHRPRGAAARHTGAIPAAIHFVEHRQQPDRIDVEHRLGAAMIAGCRIVAAEGQDVVKPFAGELPGFAFEAVAIEVLAREMNQNFLAAVEDRLAERHRAELRIAAGVVGDRDPVDSIAMHELRGERAGANRLGVGHGAARGHQFHADREIGGFRQFIAERIHSFEPRASRLPGRGGVECYQAGTGHNSLNNSTARVASGPYPSAPISSANVWLTGAPPMQTLTCSSPSCLSVSMTTRM